MSLETTLYRLSHHNELLFWKIRVVDCQVHINHGFAPDNTTSNLTTTTHPSPEKALQEASSRTDEKINRQGYSLEVPTKQPDLPMLAQELNKQEFNGYAIQPKLDGIRCIASSEGLYSRRNKQFTSAPWIEYLCASLPRGLKLDGELCIKNTPFNVIESYVMRGTPDKAIQQVLELHVFDVICTDVGYRIRHDEVTSALETLQQRFKFIENLALHPVRKTPWYNPKFPFVQVPTEFFIGNSLTHDRPQLEERLIQYKQQGYEGLIIRDLTTPYEINKRSTSLLKLKQFRDNDYEIIDVIEGHDKQGIFVCQNDNGVSFKVNPGWPKMKKQMILLNKDRYIGKLLKVEHEGIFDSGKPRCPIGVHVYSDKERP